jgi:predicted Zn-ribbon and HTH transcriptional regulator
MDIWCFTCEKLFHSIWNNFRRGHGCHRCASRERGVRRRLDIDTVSREFKAKGWKILSPEKFKGNSSKLNVMCPKGHTTTKTYSDFQQGKGCWECKSENASKRYRISEEDANKIAETARMKILKHSYKNVKTKIPLECLDCGFQFENTLDSLKWKKVGCPKCKCSYGERQLLNYFESRPEFAYEREYKFLDCPEDELEGCKEERYLPFDMWIEPEDGLEMIIEIDGIQHFEPVGMFGGQEAFERQRRVDIKKSIYCYEYGIPLLRISYNDVDNIEEILEHFIATYRYKCRPDSLMYSNRKDYTDLMTAIKADLQKN